MSYVTVFDISTGVLILCEITHSSFLSITNFLCDQIFKYLYFMSGAEFTIWLPISPDSAW